MKVNINKKSINPRAKMIVATGMRGIGKTTQTRKEVELYLKTTGLRVLAFDINGDDYEDFDTIPPSSIRRIGVGVKKRILPFKDTDNGRVPLSKEDIKQLLTMILRNFYNGLLILDDVDRHSKGQAGHEVISAITGCRHLGTDILLTHQSIAKISPTVWENIDILRMHKQQDSVKKYKNRINNYPLVRIGQFIVDRYYFFVSQQFNEKKISKEEYYKLRSYFVTINFENNKIYGCTKKQFLVGAKLLISEDTSLIREEMNKLKIFGKTHTKKAAIESLLEKFMLNYGGEKIPFYK
jgi:hypothetical protein